MSDETIEETRLRFHGGPAASAVPVVFFVVWAVVQSGLLVRIGDSKLHVRDGEHSLVDRQVRLKVTSFDAGSNEGQAELLSVVDDD